MQYICKPPLFKKENCVVKNIFSMLSVFMCFALASVSRGEIAFSPGDGPHTYQCTVSKIGIANSDTGRPGFVEVLSVVVTPKAHYVGKIFGTGDVTYYLDNQNVYGGTQTDLGIVVMKDHYIRKAFYAGNATRVAFYDYDKLFKIDCIPKP
jgi:hypothetical protein